MADVEDDQVVNECERIQSLETQDIDGVPTESFLKQLLMCMSPAQCIAPSEASCHIPLMDVIEIEDLVPPLMKDMKHESRSRTVALQRLCRLTDREHKENRIPIICTTKFNFCPVLAPCLSPDACASDRRQALLLLNNLCIPMENKAAIMLGEPCDFILPALLRIIRERLGEAYLAAACLFNLSFCQDAKDRFLSYVPPEHMQGIAAGRDDYKYQPPLENPLSCLRTMESYMILVSPSLQQQRQKIQNGNNGNAKNVAVSVEGEAVRWCTGVCRNLATESENCEIIGTQTQIPSLVAEFLRSSDRDLSFWTRDSLEECSLMLLVHLAKNDKCVVKLPMPLTKDALRKIIGKGGIHELRAKVTLARLDEIAVDSEEADEKKRSL